MQRGVAAKTVNNYSDGARGQCGCSEPPFRWVC